MISIADPDHHSAGGRYLGSVGYFAFIRIRIETKTLGRVKPQEGLIIC